MELVGEASSEDTLRATRKDGALDHGDPEGIRTPDLHRDRVAC